MKKTLIPFFALLIACGNNPETTTTVEKTDTTAVVNQPQDIQTIFEKDWRNFKIAIKDKDGPAISHFLDTDAIDVDGLILAFSEEAYAQKLEDTGYDQLIDSEWENKTVKEFSAGVEFTDEEGNTYESAIFLYFEEQERGLKLVNVLMAG